MPHIRPFKGFYPSIELIDSVAVYIESMSLEEARKERDRNPLSYIHILVPDIGNAEVLGNKEDMAFEKISENFSRFIRDGILVQDFNEALYIVQINDNGNVYTGIWALTSIDDYLHNRIKKHELIRAERVKYIQNYIEKAHLDANPVLITYQDDFQINALLESKVKSDPLLCFYLNKIEHKLWKIANPDDLLEIEQLFLSIESAYIADGHHRAEAFAMFGELMRKQNPEYTGEKNYNFFSSVYLSKSQLKVYPFHRVLSDLNGNTTESFLHQVRRSFHINQVEEPLMHPGSILMCLKGLYFVLFAKDHILNKSGLVSNLDVSLLQDYILSPILGIHDPTSNPGIKFMANGEISSVISSNDFEVAFLLNPPDIEAIVKVANANEVMPPKSTFILPKFPVGMLINKIE